MIQHAGAIEGRFVTLRETRDGVGESFQSTVDVAAVFVSRREVEVCAERSRIELHGFDVPLDGGGWFFQIHHVQVGEVVRSADVLGADFHRTLIRRNRPVKILVLRQRIRVIHEQAEIVGMQCDALLRHSQRTHVLIHIQQQRRVVDVKINQRRISFRQCFVDS